MKRTKKRLSLDTQKLRALAGAELEVVQGGNLEVVGDAYCGPSRAECPPTSKLWICGGN